MEDGWSAEKMEVDEGGQQDGSATPEFGAATEKIKEETSDIIHEWAHHGDELQRGCAQNLRFLA